MIKFFKKAVSAFLATIMCIPAGIVNVASAEENSTGTVTTVTLTDTDNGLMQFSQECMDASTASQDGYHMVQVGEDGQMDQIENDGSMWAFNNGDKVEVELIPDDGYNVKSFTIKSADDGNVMAHKETMDNVFSFTMPGESLTVEAVFSNSSTIEIVPGDELADGGELDVESKYHDITETSEISKEEVEEVIFDLTTESYIKANLNPDYMTLGERNAPVDALNIKHTIFDGRYVEKNDTIDSIMNSIESENDPDYEKNEMKVISQVGALSYIYDFNEDSDYYVTYANTMIKDEEYTVQDWAFAYNDFTGRSFDGCVYDNETGLLYIPKSLYDQLNKEEGSEGIAMMSLQIQFIQVYYDKDAMEGLADTEVPDMQSDVCTVDVNDEETAIDVNTDTQDVFSLETVTSVSPGMDTENMNVAINGMIVPEDVYEYDPETGNLTVAMSPASVVSVEAWEGEKTVQDQIISLTADDVEAVTYKGMKSLAVVKLNSKKAVDKVTKEDRIMKLYGTLTYKNSATSATGNEPYYITADGPGDYMDASIRMANWLTDNNKTLSYANIKPNKIGVGADMYIGSNLSNYSLVNKDQKWINNYSKFLKKIKIQSICMHIEKAYLGTSKASNKARFNVRIVKVFKGSTKKKVSGNTTKYSKKGYIVFGILSPKICDQTTCNLLKIKFEASWKTTKDPEPTDPFRLFLYKAEADDVKGEKFPYASLGNAVFTVKYYPSKEFSTVKEIENSGVKPKCTWSFVTKDYGDAGSNLFQEKGDVVEGIYNESGDVTVAGIQFEASNMNDERDKWKNEFIMPEDLKSWQNNFGKEGTYLIQEATPPGGFLNDGEMFPSGNPGAAKKPGTGAVVYMKPNDDPAKRVLKINGKKRQEGVVFTSNNPREAIIVKENPDTVDVWSNASFTSTGTQYIKTGDSTVKVKDSIKIQTAKITKGIYKLTTSLKIQGENEFITVDWDAVPDSVIGEANPSLPEFGNSIEVTKSTEEASTGSKDIEPGSVCTIEVSGTIPTAGLTGKKLVFINNLQVIDEEKHIASIIDGDSFDDYLTEEDGDVDNEEGEENNEADESNDIWLKTMEDDEAETLYFDEEGRAGTTILGDQIQRKSGTGESIAYAGPGQTVTDTIEYHGLTPGKSYTVKGWLVDAETNAAAKDASGTEIRTESAQTAAASGNGKWDIKYAFDATGMDGKKLVSFVEIYDGGSTPAFAFKDVNDKYETFVIPQVQTQLKDADTGTNLTAAGNSILIDTITYKNLLPNLRYKIVSSLVDAETGKIGTDKNGNPMQCVNYKTATGTSGTFEIEMSFAIDKAKVYVAFEEIYLEKEKADSGEWELVAAHKDVNDQNQRTVVPSIKTFAKDQKTNGHLSYAEKNMFLYDTVHYEDIIPGKKYFLYSDLIDAATGEIVVDENGKKQSLVSEFIADEDFDAGRYGSYGDIIPNNHDGNGVTFSLSGESYAGRTFVVFERMYMEDDDGNLQLVADHQDLADENQTIHIPKIWTNAIDIESQSNISYADETARIRDTISYENVIPGLTYEIQGRVVDKKKTQESGTEVVVVGTDGKEARNSVIFTADKSNGTKELTFDIDMKKYVDDLNKSYAGAVFVVYEDLYVIQRYDGTDHRCIVASHTDINDENQTMYLPKITTSLDDAKTGTKLSYAEADAHLIDTINYFNMKPNTQYTVKGRLYDMEDGKILEGSEKEQQKHKKRQTAP